MAIKFEIDAESILKQLGDFKEEVKKDIEKSIENLTTITKARIVEYADVLSSETNKIYMNALSEPDKVSPNVWVISLDEKALWIEEGIEAGKDMKPALLKGRNSRVIPFHYDKPKSQNTQFTQNVVSEIKKELRKRKLSVSKIEKNPDGSPRLGRLHEFNFGGEVPGRGNTPILRKLNIYQHQNQKTGKVERHVLTFRTVTNGPASAGKWISPGYTAKKFMDKALEQAEKDWENQILPELLSKWGSK